MFEPLRSLENKPFFGEPSNSGEEGGVSSSRRTHRSLPEPSLDRPGLDTVGLMTLHSVLVSMSDSESRLWTASVCGLMKP